VTGKSKDNSSGGSRIGDSGTPGGQQAIERLERALADETATSASLRDNLDALRPRVEQLESSFDQKLGAATARNQTAEARLAEQQTRLAALGQGRAETMLALSEARAELARLKVERDQLRQQLTRIEGMQTATVALPDGDVEEPGIHEAPPSLEELMASLGTFEERGSAERTEGHLHLRVETPSADESQEMIAPELVFPEEYGETPPAVVAQATPSGSTSRVLVLVESGQPIKYPLFKDVMTIGRSDSADIQVKGDYVSRVHVRVVSTTAGVVVEDVSSKNGIKVNAAHTKRQKLRHGDVLGVGRARFTFIDTVVAELD
jgi:uncharacterized coiled-coil protein SlyX